MRQWAIRLSTGETIGDAMVGILPCVALHVFPCAGFPWLMVHPGRVVRRMSYRRGHGRVSSYDTIPFDSTLITRSRVSLWRRTVFIDDTAGGHVVV